VPVCLDFVRGVVGLQNAGNYAVNVNALCGVRMEDWERKRSWKLRQRRHVMVDELNCAAKPQKKYTTCNYLPIYFYHGRKRF
jgi:hypothetical protein